MIYQKTWPNIFPQWMICGPSSRQACSGYSTHIFHPRPAHHVSLIHGSPQRHIPLATAKPEHIAFKSKFSNNIEDCGKYKEAEGRCEELTGATLSTRTSLQTISVFTPMSKVPTRLTRVCCKQDVRTYNLQLSRKHLNSYKSTWFSIKAFVRDITQLISAIQDISKTLKSGKDQVDGLLLDFAKAFDKVRTFFKGFCCS